MANAVSPELQALKEFNDQLVKALAQQVHYITWELFHAGVINHSVKRKILETNYTNVERETRSESCAAELMRGVETAISENPEKIEGFLKVLEKYQETCGMVLSHLKRYLIKKIGKEKYLLKSNSFGRNPACNTLVPLLAMRRGSESMVVGNCDMPSISSRSRYVIPQSQKMKQVVNKTSGEKSQNYRWKRRESAPTLQHSHDSTQAKAQQQISSNRRRASLNFAMLTNIAGVTILEDCTPPLTESFQQNVGMSPPTNQEHLPRENDRISGVPLGNDRNPGTGVDQQQQSHTNHSPVESPAHSYQPATSAEHPTQQTSDLKDTLQSFNNCVASDSVSMTSSSSSKETSLYEGQEVVPAQQSKRTPPQERHSPQK